MDITEFVLEELRLHPSAQPQDIAKLCYQAAFGAEHLLLDKEKAQAYLEEEYRRTPADDKPLTEQIAPSVCRVNLSAWKRIGLPQEWLWRAFYSSVSERAAHPTATPLFDYINQVDKLCQAGQLPFSYAQWREYILASGFEENPHPVHHSPIYRENEAPAYRIISGWHTAIIPILGKMSQCKGGVIAIEGRAAAGKTTIASYLANIIGIAPIHMDDFFLPPALRTQERLATPGGNVHHERFAQEVLPHLQKGQAFEYRKFDCNAMDYNGVAKVVANTWRIVEGVYSFHPSFGNYMDIRVFLDVKPEVQKARIELRNSPQMVENYINKWIPMEETYFRAYDVQEAADVILRMP